MLGLFALPVSQIPTTLELFTRPTQKQVGGNLTSAEPFCAPFVDERDLVLLADACTELQISKSSTM